MNVISKTLMCASIALAAGSSFAMDATKKDEPMANQGVMKKNMTMKECKEHMAMAKKGGMTKDDAMMHSDAMCADMMKKHGTGSHKRGTGTGTSTDRSGAGVDTDRTGTDMGTDKQRSGTDSQSTMPK